jgi:hypothetical protein
MSETQAKAQFAHEGTSDVQPVHRSPKEAAVSNQFNADNLSHSAENAMAAAESNQFGPNVKVQSDWTD